MKIGFIGCGNMGGALVKGVSKAAESFEILLSDKAAEKTAALSKETGAFVSDTETVISQCQYIFLGVKPNMMTDLLKNIGNTLLSRKDRVVLISMAAGTSVPELREMLKKSTEDGTVQKKADDIPIIRIMPNLAVAVGEGMILYSADRTEDGEINIFLDFMRFTGVLCSVEEKMIDAGSAISGCGPAFIFQFAEALADGGVSCGLTRDTAMLLAAQTLKGSAALLLESGKHPGKLKDEVCSPGGTTIAGVLTLEKYAFRSAASEAVIAAYEKTLRLKK